jgi:hypothetical protein
VANLLVGGIGRHDNDAMRLLSLLVLVLGCSKAVPPAGKPVSVGAVCNEPDRSYVRLDGYLRYRRGLLSFCSNYGGHKTCDLELHEKAERPPAFDIMKPSTGPAPVTARLSVPVGDGPGEMNDLPEKFKDSDIKLHLPQGAVAVEGTRVLIDGSVTVIPGDPKTPNAAKACFVTVKWATGG